MFIFKMFKVVVKWGTRDTFNVFNGYRVNSKRVRKKRFCFPS